MSYVGEHGSCLVLLGEPTMFSWRILYTISARKGDVERSRFEGEEYLAYDWGKLASVTCSPPLCCSCNPMVTP